MNTDRDLERDARSTDPTGPRSYGPQPSAADGGVAARGDRPGAPLPGQPYTSSLNTPTARWWKPIVGILVGAVVILGGNLLLVGGVMVFETFVLDVPLGTMTPLVYGASLVGLILLIPTTWLLVRFLHGQPFGFNSSVTGRLRWGWVLRVFPVLLALFALYMVGFTALAPQGAVPGDNWWIFALLSVVFMPFQAAAEEIFFRGYVQRAAGSWATGEQAVFVVGTALSAGLFMVAHAAMDPWLNLYYFAFGVLLSVAARLTGGLEIPILLHVVNNVSAGVVGAYTQDMESAFDRSAGVGGPFMLIQVGVLALCVAALVWWARRSGLQQRVAA